jgi:hypothetical protein
MMVNDCAFDSYLVVPLLSSHLSFGLGVSWRVWAVEREAHRDVLLLASAELLALVAT